MTTTEEFLEHHGVKGQKWGVRRAKLQRKVERTRRNNRGLGKAGERKIAKVEMKADAKWLDGMNSPKVFIEVHNETAKRFNQTISSINNKPEFKDKNLFNDLALKDKYDKEVEASWNNHWLKASTAIIGTSPSGKFGMKMHGDQLLVSDLKTGRPVKFDKKGHQVQHADSSLPVITVIRDGTGHIVGTKITGSSAQHSDVDSFLEHHGVKGQKWGVRRRSTHPPSEDHATVAQLKKKPLHALSNKELKTANERLNLEQNFRRMNPTKVQKGAKTTKKLLATVGVSSVAAFLKTDAGKRTVARGAKFLARNKPHLRAIA